MAKARTTATAVLLALAVALTGCSGSAKRPTTAEPAPTRSPAPAETSPPPPGAGPATGSVVVAIGGGRRLDATLLGLHENGISTGGVPRTPFGAVRLWDSGTTWRDLEPASGRWNWAPLDKAVDTAAAAHAAPLLVLGQTPAFAATSLSSGVYGPGANAMPVPARWKTYVRAVATRYKGRIHEYEVWNEPNVSQFWAGTPQQLAGLAVSARAIIKAIDPTAIVTTPGLAVRRPTQRGWLSRYLAAGGTAAADVISIHLYPDAKAAPEDVLALMTDVRTRLSAAKATQPVWDTEINYGLATDAATTTSTLSPAVQAGYVARTFLVGASLGLGRTYWYAWDNQSVGVRTVGAGGTPTAAGTAFGTVYGWLVGHEFRGCSADAVDTWSCYVDDDRIVWNVTGTQRLAAPPGTTAVVTVDGRTAPLGSGEISVGAAPVRLVGAG